MKSDRPTIVCLCGSTRFWRQFQVSGLAETLAGRIVLSIGAASGTDDEHFGNLPAPEYDRLKAMLDELHMRKIDLADEVLILNVGDYVGDSTRRELYYARANGKRVRWLVASERVLPGEAVG
jgi:cell division protein FtsB